MSDLFWPGDHCAGAVMSDVALLTALAAVENAWLTVLVDTGVAPATATPRISRALVSQADLEDIAVAAENWDGQSVTALVALLRARAGDATATWLHRGLTSQDVLDTALMLCARDAQAAVRTHLTAQVHALVALIETHRDTAVLTRTLTQAALLPAPSAASSRRLAHRHPGRRRTPCRPLAFSGAVRRRGRHHGGGDRTVRVT